MDTPLRLRPCQKLRNSSADPSTIPPHPLLHLPLLLIILHHLPHVDHLVHVGAELLHPHPHHRNVVHQGGILF